MSNSTEAKATALPSPGNIWLRGFMAFLVLLLFHLALTLSAFCAVLQFLWTLFARERSARLAEFGSQLANWCAISVRFVSGASDQKPFPWTDWG